MSQSMVKATKNGYDPRWIEAINGVLEDRDEDVRIIDITDELWARFIGPMVDALTDEDADVLADFEVEEDEK